MTNPTPDNSAIGLLDDYACNAMIALMQSYAPEEWPADERQALKWCDWIAVRSYIMAASMMDARHKFHAVLTEVQQEKEEAAND